MGFAKQANRSRPCWGSPWSTTVRVLVGSLVDRGSDKVRAGMHLQDSALHVGASSANCTLLVVGFRYTVGDSSIGIGYKNY